MKKQVWRLVGCMGWIVFAAWEVVGAADKIEMYKTKKMDEVTESPPGTITKDTFMGTTLEVDGKAREIPRPLVIQQHYGSGDMKSLLAGIQACKDGDYAKALSALAAAEKSIEKMPRDQQELFAQHVRYYQAVALMKSGKAEAAAKKFDDIFVKKDTFWYFEAELGKCECLELQGQYQAAMSNYTRLFTDFEAKREKAPWVDMYIFPAKLGKLRAEANNPGTAEGRLKEIIGEVGKLLEEKAYQPYITDDHRTQESRIRAIVYKRRKEFDELIKALANPIRIAVQNNNREALGGLYLDRADAYWGLMENEKDEAKKKEYAIAARFEYLRVALGYNISKEESARAQYRLALLFVQLGGKDAKSRAIGFCNAVKKLKVDPYAKDIEEVLKKANEMKEG